MTSVIGIDLSLTSTGLARITTDTAGMWLAETSCRPSKPTGANLAARDARIRGIRDDVVTWTVPCRLAVIEAPIPSGHGAGTFERAWLWGMVVSALIARRVPVIAVPPATRAKFTAASGGADKAAVALAAGRMWPEWTPGVSHGVNDQADALALASIGVVLAGLTPPFAMPAYRLDALRKLPRLEPLT